MKNINFCLWVKKNSIYKFFVNYLPALKPSKPQQQEKKKAHKSTGFKGKPFRVPFSRLLPLSFGSEISGRWVYNNLSGLGPGGDGREWLGWGALGGPWPCPAGLTKLHQYFLCCKDLALGVESTSLTYWTWHCILPPAGTSVGTFAQQWLDPSVLLVDLVISASFVRGEGHDV